MKVFKSVPRAAVWCLGFPISVAYYNCRNECQMRPQLWCSALTETQFMLKHNQTQLPIRDLATLFRCKKKIISRHNVNEKSKLWKCSGSVLEGLFQASRPPEPLAIPPTIPVWKSACQTELWASFWFQQVPESPRGVPVGAYLDITESPWRLHGSIWWHLV